MVTVPQRSFSGGELAPSLHGRSDLAKYQTGARVLRNFFVMPHGGVASRPGTRFLGAAKLQDGFVRLIPFEFSTTQTYALEFGDRYMRVWSRGAQVVYPAGHAQAGLPVEIATPYLAGQLRLLKFTQSADVLTITHPAHAPRDLSRQDHHVWTLATIPLAPTLPAPGGLVVVASAPLSPVGVTPIPPNTVDRTKVTIETYGYVVTAQHQSGEESLPSGAVTITGMKLGQALPGTSDPVVYPYHHLAWAPVAGAVKYNVYKDDAQSGLYGFIGATKTLDFRDDNIAPDRTDAPPGQRDPFAGGNFPGAVTYHQQRRLFGGSAAEPQTLWGSASGNYRNFNVSEPSKDDDAVTFTIASNQVNEIRHFISLGVLLVLTSGGEFVVSGGSGESDVITPSSVSVRPQGYRGSSHVAPLVIGETALFVQQKGSSVRDLAYNIQSDGYTGNDLSVLSAHLFEGHSIVDWCYAQTPHSVVWAVRSDGALLSLTYLREHDVWGWARHDTQGAVETVCSISEGAEDAVYMVVRRTVGGQVRRYVERLESRLVTDVRCAWCVDSGLSYAGSEVTELSGLDHLEGLEVAILADGSVMPRQVVTGGQVHLARAASRITVGLPYLCQIRTLRLELGGEAASRRRRVVSLQVMVERSRGLWAGPGLDRMVEVKQRDVEPYGAPIELVTGDLLITVPPSWDRDGSVWLEQRDPLPLTVLAVIPEVDVGG